MLDKHSHAANVKIVKNEQENEVGGADKDEESRVRNARVFQLDFEINGVILRRNAAIKGPNDEIRRNVVGKLEK